MADENETLEIDYLSELEKIPEFTEGTREDKELLADLWVRETGKRAGFSLGSEYEALRADVRSQLDPTFVDPELVAKVGAIEEPELTLLERGMEEVKAAGKGLRKAAQVFAVEPFEELTQIIKKSEKRSLKENMEALGQATVEAGLHAGGIIPRTGLTVEQMLLQGAGAIIGLMGEEGRNVNAWLNEYVNTLETSKEELRLIKNEISQFEPDIAIAAMTAARVAGWMRNATAKATASTLELGIPGMSAGDVAVSAGLATTIGETAVVNPVLIATNEYINESGYDEETKQILRFTAPILTGIISGATVERRMEKLLNAPEAVSEVKRLVKAGAGPEEVKAAAEKHFKVPDLFDDSAKMTDGNPTAETVRPVTVEPIKRPEAQKAMEDFFNAMKKGEAIEEAPVIEKAELPSLMEKAVGRVGQVEDMVKRGFTREQQIDDIIRDSVTQKADLAKAFSDRGKAKMATKFENEALRNAKKLTAAGAPPEKIEQALSSLPRQVEDVVDDFTTFKSEEIEFTPHQTRVPVEQVGKRLMFPVNELAEQHGEIFEIFPKYFKPERIRAMLDTAGKVDSLNDEHVTNLLGMTYRIPQNQQRWTTSVIDDMITVAKHTEGLYEEVLKKGRSSIGLAKNEIASRIDNLGKKGIYSEDEQKFLKGILNIIKKDDGLFNFVATKGFGEGKKGTRGTFAFSKNLIALKDPEAFPHEVGHWGFYNGLTGKERLEFLHLIRDKVAAGWQPGENLVHHSYNVYPSKIKEGAGLASNKQQDLGEYFAEQFAQYVYTRQVDEPLMRRLFRKLHTWAQRLMHGMKNEKILDRDLEPFFQKWAKLDREEVLRHEDLDQFAQAQDVISDMVNRTRSFAVKLKAEMPSDVPRIDRDPIVGGPLHKRVQDFFKTQVIDAVQADDLSLEDGRRLLDLGKQGLNKVLFAPSETEIAKMMRTLEVTGVRNSAMQKLNTAAVSNAGFVDPHFLRTTMLHGMPLLWGIEERDGRLHFNVAKYAKGASVWYGIGFGGKAWRRLRAPERIKGVSKSFNEKFWGLLEPPEDIAEKSVFTRALYGVGKGLNYMRPTEGLDPEVWALGKQFQAEHRQLRRKLETFVADMKKTFNAEEREMLSDIIEREGDWENASDMLKATAEDIRRMMGQVREKLIESGVDPVAVNKYGDEYLHRVYLPKLVKGKAYRSMKKSLKAMQKSYLNRRGVDYSFKNPEKSFQFKPEELAEGESVFKVGEKVFSFVDNQGHRRWAHEKQTGKVRELTKRYGKGTEWRVIPPEKGKITINRPHSKAERVAMGEARDATLRLAVFFREASHDIALGKVFKDISENSDFTLRIPEGLDQKQAAAFAREKGYTFVKPMKTTRGVERHGVLAGKYVRDDVAQMLGNLTHQRYTNEWAEAMATVWRKAIGVWKISKTAYNPATHVLNTMTNLHICLMDGRSPIATVYNGIESLARKGQFYQEAVDAGLIDSGILRGEWDLDKFVTEVGTSGGTDADVPRILKGIAQAYQGVKKVAKVPMQVYEWEDEVFKLGVFRAERLAGRNPQEALEAANRLFFDYGDVPRGVRFLRDTAIMPFISYTYKVIPMIARTMVEHPERLAAMLLAYKAINDWNYEREFGARAEEQEKLERKVMPEWQQKKFFGIGPSTQIRLSTDKETGEARFFNAGRYIPGADLFEDTTNAFPFGMNPILSLVYGFSSNKHPAFGGKLLPHDDPKTQIEKEENLEASVKFLTNTLLPNVPGIPGTYSSEKVGNALVAEGVIDENSVLWDYAQRQGWTGKNYFGHDEHLLESLFHSAGLKVTRTDIEQARSMALQRQTREFGRAKSELRARLREKRTTPARRERALEQYKQRVGMAQEEIEELMR